MSTAVASRKRKTNGKAPPPKLVAAQAADLDTLERVGERRYLSGEAVAGTGFSPLTSGNAIGFGYESLEEAFPPVDPPVEPFGDYGLFQIRHPKKKTKGGIFLEQSSRSTEYYNTQVAKVIALGPLCFKTQITESVTDPITEARENVLRLLGWPEGPWFDVGDFVRVPKYAGDRIAVTVKDMAGEEDEIIFVLFRAKAILAKEKYPLTTKAYLD